MAAAAAPTASDIAQVYAAPPASHVATVYTAPPASAAPPAAHVASIYGAPSASAAGQVTCVSTVPPVQSVVPSTAAPLEGQFDPDSADQRATPFDLGRLILPLLVSGMFLFSFGYSAPLWHTQDNQKSGIWETCTCYNTRDRTSWQTGVQLSATFGLISLIICVVSFSLYVFVKANSAFLVTTVIFAFSAALVILVTVVVFGGNTRHYGGQLEFAFAFAVLSAIFIMISGVLAAVHLIKSGILDGCCRDILGT